MVVVTTILVVLLSNAHFLIGCAAISYLSSTKLAPRTPHINIIKIKKNAPYRGGVSRFWSLKKMCVEYVLQYSSIFYSILMIVKNHQPLLAARSLFSPAYHLWLFEKEAKQVACLSMHQNIIQMWCVARSSVCEGRFQADYSVLQRAKHS